MQAVQAAKQAWGERKLEELEAEERLAFACERARTNDEVTLQLRSAFKVRQQQAACALSSLQALSDLAAAEVQRQGGINGPLSW